MKLTEEQIKQQLNNTLGELWAIVYIHYTPYNTHRWVEYYNNKEEAIYDYNTQKERIVKETDAPGFHSCIKEPVRVEYTLILTD